MSELQKVTGITLSVYPVGENDRRLTILTKERGKVQVFARGCRRPNHPLFGVSQPLIYCEFMVSDSRRYTYLSSADCKDSFFFLKESLDNIYYASYFAEAAEYFTVEGQDERNILNLLFVTFHAIKKALIPLPLIRRIYELKLLQFAGLGMECFSCLSCGSTEDLHAVSFHDGGVYCDNCVRERENTSRIEPAALYVLQYVTASPLNQIYAFAIDEKVGDEFCWIVKRYFAAHVEHKFKAAKMIEEL